MASRTETAPSKTTDAGRDPKVETWIRSYGITEYEFLTDVPVDEFDMDKCLSNQARVSQAVNQTAVADYQRDMEAGDVFPAVVAYRQRGKLITIDGNHRLVAKDQAGQTLSVYVVRAAKPSVLVIMTFEANVRHGMRSSPEDRIAQALWMLDNKVSTQDAARRLGLSPGDITKAVTQKRSDENADSAGIAAADWWKKIPAGHRRRLGQIRTNEGLAAAARLVYETNMGLDEVTRLVSDLNDLRSDKLMVAFVEGKRAELSEVIQGTGAGIVGADANRRSRSPVSGLRTAITKFEGLPPAATIVTGIGPAERDSVAEGCRAAAKRLLEVAEALERA